jgi:hypothetical protein
MGGVHRHKNRGEIWSRRHVLRKENIPITSIE